MNPLAKHVFSVMAISAKMHNILDRLNDENMQPAKNNFENSLNKTVKNIELNHDQKKELLEKLKEEVMAVELIVSSEKELEENKKIVSVLEKIKEKMLEKEQELN